MSSAGLAFRIDQHLQIKLLVQKVNRQTEKKNEHDQYVNIICRLSFAHRL